MPVPFQEIAGSPIEEYSLEGFYARREFVLAWEDRDAFAVEVLGAAVTHGGSTWVGYPGKRSVYAVKLRYEPLDPDGLDQKTLAGLAAGLNSYSHSLAKAIVEYRTTSGRDRTDGPENEPGTHLTYRMNCVAEYQALSPRGWQWEDDPSQVLPDDPPLARRVPMTEHHLTWQQVVNPPWEAIDRLQGTVNAQPFLGCAAETLLFEGAEANKLYRAGIAAAASTFCWQIHYRFLQRAVKQGGQTVGWNHGWRGEPAGWARLINSRGPLYDRADFASLFQSARTSP
jgi:hypothetical protein